jgi:hypothetical protein
MRYTALGAIVSDDQRFRYRLWRRWDDEKPVMAFIMLNPSTADGTVDDPTIRKCVGFADRAGCGGIEVVNLFAYRATSPADLRRAGYLSGPDNDRHARSVLLGYSTVVCAWGQHGNSRAASQRVKWLREVFDELEVSPSALRFAKDGTPCHPLMLPYSCEPAPWHYWE